MTTKQKGKAPRVSSAPVAFTLPATQPAFASDAITAGKRAVAEGKATIALRTSAADMIKHGVKSAHFDRTRKGGEYVTPERPILMGYIAQGALTPAQFRKWREAGGPLAKGKGGGASGQPRDAMGQLIDIVAKATNRIAELVKELEAGADSKGGRGRAGAGGDSIVTNLGKARKTLATLVEAARKDKTTDAQATRIAYLGGIANVKKALKRADVLLADLPRK